VENAPCRWWTFLSLVNREGLDWPINQGVLTG
jgi:hypothetical protein